MFHITNDQASKIFHEILPYTTLPTFFHYVTLIYYTGITVTLLSILALLLHLILRLRYSIQEQSVFLELTPPAFTQKSAYTTQQLFAVLHGIGNQKNIIEKLLGKKTMLSFEIVSTKDKGIRYIIRTNTEPAENVKRNILSYLPYVKISEIDDYIATKTNNRKHSIIEYTLKKKFPFPLAKQDLLDKHDPIAYLTGLMTNVQHEEIIALHIIVSPSQVNTKSLSHKITRQEDILSELERIDVPSFLKPFAFLAKYILLPLLKFVHEFILWFIDFLTTSSNTRIQQNRHTQNGQKPARVISSFEKEITQSIQEKIDQPLFETTIRIFMRIENKEERKQRIQGIKSFFALFSVPKYQALVQKFSILPFNKFTYFALEKRLLSPIRNSSLTILSVSELADLYHFPYTHTSHTEDTAKLLSSELPAPLVLKNPKNLSVIFGENTYANKKTPIGLTDDERARHIFIEGQTGSGKSTLIFHMIKDDIQKGKGVCVIDPHGDLIEDLLHIIPEERVNDVVYVNPFDVKYPIRINLLELTNDLDEDEQELEKEQIAESIISIFRRVFSEDEKTNAHRIERILRNSIYTAFYAKEPTIFTVNKLLTNEQYRQEILLNVDNEDLLDFWKNEFGKAGEWQVFKMIDGVTAKVERFLFSPVAKRILEQPKSTISLEDLLDEGRIILCNLSEGKIGEDTSRLLGTALITKIHLTMLKRARIEKELRTPFYLYVDEFQTFATKSFTKLLSGGRKFGLRVIMAEQTTTQQDDDKVTQRILANVGTVICFRTASPVDEELMLAQFSPLVKKGELGNLARFHFYIKLGAVEPQEPFSGQTFPIQLTKDPEKVQRIIESSRKQYASVYKKQKQGEKAVNRKQKHSEKKEKLGTLSDS